MNSGPRVVLYEMKCDLWMKRRKFIHFDDMKSHKNEISWIMKIFFSHTHILRANTDSDVKKFHVDRAFLRGAFATILINIKHFFPFAISHMTSLDLYSALRMTELWMWHKDMIRVYDQLQNIMRNGEWVRDLMTR